jgi:septation ring formation regulator EzrA
MLELLTKLKEAAKVPEHAARRVRRLDEMVSHLRKAKRSVDDNVAADEAELARLDREAADLERVLSEITAHKKAMEAERDDIRKRLAAGEEGFTMFIRETSQTTRQTTRAQAAHRKKMVSEDLRVSRGFSVDKESKPHLESPASILAKAKALSRRAPGLR